MTDTRSMQYEYDQLPEPVKLVYSFMEYCTLTDRERITIVQQECEPEWDD